MSLRRLQRRASTLVRDGGLLAALRSEINHELSSPLYQKDESRNEVKGFAVELAHPSVKDVLLRRLHGCGGGGGGGAGSVVEEEEVVVSAMLAPLDFQDEDPLPRNVLMKVCVRKPGKSPILQFDCTVFSRQEDRGDSQFAIRNAFYHPSMGPLGKNKYRGPIFSSLDPQLQKEYKDYLVSRGITSDLTNFLLEHLETTEQNQYLSWLRSVESIITKSV